MPSSHCRVRPNIRLSVRHWRIEYTDVDGLRRSHSSSGSDLGDRLKSAPDDAGLVQRKANIQAALVKIEPEYTKAMSAVIQAGNFALESGDGAGGADADRKLNRRFTPTGAMSSQIADAMLDAGFNLKSRPRPARCGVRRRDGARRRR